MEMFSEPLIELAAIFGLELLPLLICFATALFFSFGISFAYFTGSRKAFIFGILPISFGTITGIFPVYFVIISSALAFIISFAYIPKTLSYKDRVRMIEIELQEKAIKQDD